MIESHFGRSCLGFVWLAFFGGALSAQADGPTTRFAATDFPLRRVPAVQAASYKPAEISRLFPAFKHEPFDTAGYNALTLPFHYADPAGGGDAAEADAFAFLLSLSLDWGRGNYCTRHAYFVFKRGREGIEPLRTEYAHGRIATVLADWSATHAVGGEVRHVAGGYAGTLEIFDRRGRTVLTKAYEEPRDYFDLLGDVSVDALTFLDKRAPSPELARHLHVRRCQNFGAVRQLGAAAELPPQGDAEFDAFERILDLDPDFGEVRAWLANQRGWRTGDWETANRERAKSLRGYLTANCFGEFDAVRAHDPALVAAEQTWLDDVARLAGDDFHAVLLRRLKWMYKAQAYDMELVERATRVAAQNPNQYELLLQLAIAYQDPAGAADADMSIGLWYAARSCHFLPAVGDKAVNLLNVANDAHDLMYCDVALQALGPKRAEPKNPHEFILRFFTLQDSGNFSRAVDEFQAMVATLGPQDPAVAFNAAASAAYAGRLDELNAARTENAAAFRQNQMGRLLDAYSALLSGHDADVGIDVPDAAANDWRYLSWAVGAAQLDLIHGRTAFRRKFDELIRLGPNERMGWVIMDAYERRAPTPSGAHFYAALEWLYPDEPTARGMVAEAKARRVQVAAPLDVEPLFDRLKQYEAVRWPSAEKSGAVPRSPPTNPNGWDVAAAVRQLLPGQPDRARELAYRYYAWAMAAPNPSPRVFANHMIHAIDDVMGRRR